MVKALVFDTLYYWFESNYFFYLLYLFLYYLMMFYFSRYTQRHAFHLVDPSVLPFITSISALVLTLSSVLYFHGYSGGLEATFIGLFGV